MNRQFASDGRVSLEREILIGLRREKGLSQELLAMLCAEQRLCVSIASIKRAETGKKILYRTARDIALFFDVNLSSLIRVTPIIGNAAQVLDIVAEQPLAERREIVLLMANLVVSDVNLQTLQYWQSACTLAAKQSEAERYDLDSLTTVFLFGTLTLMGYEAFQAINCCWRLQKLMHPILSANCTLVNQIDYHEMVVQGNGMLPDSESLIRMLSEDCCTKKIVDSSVTGTVLVTESIKHVLESRYHTSPYQTNTSSPVAEQLWQVTDQKLKVAPHRQIIGRQLQCQQFKAVVESVAAYQELQVVYVRGMAGIGKTRLLEELCNYANGMGICCYKALVLDFGMEQGHTAIPKLIRSILKLEATETNLSFEQLSARVKGKAFEQRDLLFLYQWLNWPLSGKELSMYNSMSHETREAGLQRVINDLVRNAASESPCLLCIEDMHWADLNLLNHIQNLAGSLRGSGVILLLSSRKENDPLQRQWASGWADMSMLVMDLAPLRINEAQELADYFEEIEPKYKLQCIERAEGNPLFLEQLLHSWCASLENGENTREEARLPHTLQALVVSRLDCLPPLSRTAVRAAAVLGQWFRLDALQFLLDNKTLDIEPLIEHYLIKHSGDQLMFVHALVHQGTYHTLTDAALTELHQRCAEWFKSRDITLYARHLKLAKDDLSVNAFYQAITYKIAQYHFDEALALIDETHTIDFIAVETYKLWLFRGEAMHGKGNIEQSVHAYEQALSVAVSAASKCTSLIGIANGLNTLDSFDAAVTALSKAESYATELGLNAKLSQIYHLRGNFYFPTGQVDFCYDQQCEALKFAKLSENMEAEARALGGLGDAAYAQGKMYQAYDYIKQCLGLCKAHDFGQIEAANRFMLATTRIYQNETQEALYDALASADLAATVGHRRAEIVSRLTASWILLDMLELEQASEQVRLGLNLAQEIGALRFEPFLRESMARYYYLQGNFCAADQEIRAAYDEVCAQQLERFIGPWVASTYALILTTGEKTNKEKTSGLLQLGSKMLDRGCVGHNYYRFYVNAIECSIINYKWDDAHRFITLFTDYTQERPTPWSDFYIDRAKMLVSVWQDPISDKRDQLIDIKSKAKANHLLASVRLIDETLVLLH